MSSLTQISGTMRKGLLVFMGVFVAGIVLKIVIVIVGALGGALTASIPAQAQNGFGTLPAININALSYNVNGKATFVLDTASGGFPSEPSLAEVYKYGQVGLSLLSLENTQQIATNYGFTGPYQQLSTSIYDWQMGSRDFVANLATNQIRITNTDPFDQINADASAQNGSLTLTEAGSIAAGNNIVQALNPSNDFDLKTPSVVYLSYNANSPYPLVVNNVSEANAIRLIYSRAYSYKQPPTLNTQGTDTSAFTLLPDDPNTGSISVTVDSDGANLTQNIIDMNFDDWPILSTTFSTYQLKSPAQAWQDVQNGSAYLVSLAGQTSSPFAPYQTLTVSSFQATNIYLSYFDGIKQQQYLEPVYVIQGTAILSDNTSATFYFYDPAAI